MKNCTIKYNHMNDDFFNTKTEVINAIQHILYASDLEVHLYWL